MAEPNGIVDSAVTAASAGGGFAGVLLAGRWLLNWLTGRFDKRQELLDAQDARVDQEWRAIRDAIGHRGDLRSPRIRMHISPDHPRMRSFWSGSQARGRLTDMFRCG